MNCRDALRLLYDVIDKEASEQDTNKVKAHLGKCHHCSAKYELEEQFRRCVEQKGNLSQECHDLRDKIFEQLDTIDHAAGEVGPFGPPFKWIAVGLALAAAIILCTIAASALSDFHFRQTELAPFIKAHLAHQVKSDPAQFGSDPYAFLFKHTGVRLKPCPYLPVENIYSVSIDTVKGIPFGRIQLRDPSGDMISIFVASKNKYHLPTEPGQIIMGCPMLVRCCQNCVIMGWEKEDVTFMTVTDEKHQPEYLAKLSTYF